ISTINGILARFDHAAWGISPSALEQAFDAEFLAGCPISVVVDHTALELFYRHAWDMANKGVVVGVFTEVASAKKFVAQKVRVFKYFTKVKMDQMKQEANPRVAQPARTASAAR
ncbi:MAG: hypothetical protein ACREVW_04280, partial [Burkholderiales bacterium]